MTSASDSRLAVPRGESLPAVAWPPAPAHVAPFVAALGPALAVEFLLRFGGAELHIAVWPRARSAWAAFVGPEAAQRLADRAHLLPRRVPLGNPWLARCLAAEDHPTAEIARRLRASDTAVCGWLKPDPHRG
ncbi:MAG: helix-turn-helix domain-containing protein [Alkalilacustris sp.]